jgi:hypothetical protein
MLSRVNDSNPWAWLAVVLLLLFALAVFIIVGFQQLS